MDPPLAIRDRLTDMVRDWGLGFAAIDLIVSSEGDFVFLELNPMGQWLWLERYVDVEITGAAVKHLVSC
jgi:D-alanine-D-alanine ligase-like ATP-grasp enzyme